MGFCGATRLINRNLRDYAEQKFSREGIEARPNSKITAVGPDWIELDGKTRGGSRFCGKLMEEPHGLLVWSTGLSPNPLMQNMENVAKDDKTQS